LKTAKSAISFENWRLILKVCFIACEIFTWDDKKKGGLGYKARFKAELTRLRSIYINVENSETCRTLLQYTRRVPILTYFTENAPPYECYHHHFLKRLNNCKLNLFEIWCNSTLILIVQMLHRHVVNSVKLWNSIIQAIGGQQRLAFVHCTWRELVLGTIYKFNEKRRIEKWDIYQRNLHI